MNKIKLIFLAIISSAIFAGCIQVNTKVNLNKDGSGTIEETFLMKNSVIDMMKEFILAFDSTKGQDFKIFNEEELKARQSSFGEGVKYISGEKILIDGYEGFKVIYSFADINKIKINPSPEDKMPLGNDEMAATDSIQGEDLTFDFYKGNPSILVINFPKQPKNEENSSIDDTTENSTEVEDSTFNAVQMQKVIDMFDGMKISLSFNFNGNIVQTDATHTNGSTITLMDVDFSEILKHKEILEELQKSKPASLESFEKLVGGLPGIKVETKEKVTVKFN
ncbi:MAG TPA: hypothetical protein PKD67_12210 [Ignavibacteriaceae bacterium]|nr:hypothetical protein [Ignavibacteriaceae bacterium]